VSTMNPPRSLPGESVGSGQNRAQVKKAVVRLAVQMPFQLFPEPEGSKNVMASQVPLHPRTTRAASVSDFMLKSLSRKPSRSLVSPRPQQAVANKPRRDTCLPPWRRP